MGMVGAIVKRLCRIVIEMHLLSCRIVIEMHLWSLVEDLELSLVGQYTTGFEVFAESGIPLGE
jgi:hypothetical protein